MSSKRHFTIIYKNEEVGMYQGRNPSSVAKKAVSKLSDGKKIIFEIREITQGSKKKVYGPYEGVKKKLDKPVKVGDRVYKYESQVKKIEKKGGAITANNIQRNINKLKEAKMKVNKMTNIIRSNKGYNEKLQNLNTINSIQASNLPRNNNTSRSIAQAENVPRSNNSSRSIPPAKNVSRNNNSSRSTVQQENVSSLPSQISPPPSSTGPPPPPPPPPPPLAQAQKPIQTQALFGELLARNQSNLKKTSPVQKPKVANQSIPGLASSPLFKRNKSENREKIEWQLKKKLTKNNLSNQNVNKIFSDIRNKYKDDIANDAILDELLKKIKVDYKGDPNLQKKLWKRRILEEGINVNNNDF